MPRKTDVSPVANKITAINKTMILANNPLIVFLNVALLNLALFMSAPGYLGLAPPVTPPGFYLKNLIRASINSAPFSFNSYFSAREFNTAPIPMEAAIPRAIGQNMVAPAADVAIAAPPK